MGISTAIHDYITRMKEACAKDPEATTIIKLLQQGGEKMHFKWEKDQLFYRNKIFVPKSDNWRKTILAEFHEGQVGGHAGRARTYKRVGRSFSWPGLQKEVKDYIAHCDTCQRHHYETVLPPGLLQPLAIPEQAWSTISMDFIDGLPKSEGKTSIWVIIDKLTKYAHFIPLSHPYSAASLAKLFVQKVSRLHGMPDNIISDRDPTFMSLF